MKNRTVEKLGVMDLNIARILIGFALVMLTLMFSSCADAPTEEELFIRGQKRLNELESYYAVVTYQVSDEEEVREYQFEQWVQAPDRYKIHMLAPENLKGKIMSCDGQKIYVENARMQDRVSFDAAVVKQQRPRFIGDFLQNYWLSEDVKKELREEDGKRYLIYECPNLELTRGQIREQLWLNAKSLLPEKLILLDAQGNMISMLLFESFEPNWKVPVDFFYTVL